MTIPTKTDWPLSKRISDALDVLEQLSKFRGDFAFMPSPFHVAASLSAARQALKEMTEQTNDCRDH
jgi:hypothetical protein